MMLHIQMKKEVAKMSERFPGIDWYCDRCNAYLNDQPGFDDHHYVWKCTECGHKIIISSYFPLLLNQPATRFVAYILFHRALPPDIQLP